MKIKSLGLKISLIVSAMIAVIIILAVFVVTRRSDVLVDSLTRAEAESANIAIEVGMERYMDEAFTRANMIAASRSVINSLLAGNVDQLKEAIEPLSSGLDLITLVDHKGDVILRTHNDKKGDNLINQKSISAALTTGTGIATIERGATVGITTAGTASIKNSAGNIIAAVKCGHDLSLPKYVDEIKETSNCEVTIFDGDTRMNTTLTDENGDRIIGTKASDEVIDTVLNQNNDYISQLTLLGNEYTVYYSPFTVDGEVIGMLFAGVNINKILSDSAAMTSEVIRVTVIAGIVSAVLVFCLSMLMIGRPLKKIGVFADKIKNGDLGLSTSTDSVTGVRSNDEVGRLAISLEQAYSQLKGYVREIEDRMEALAMGDLTAGSTYDFYGDFVFIKNSINQIVANLNNTMGEINSSSVLVSSGAKQIAHAAQAMAQGSTEQAATVQQLAASTIEIAEKTKANSEMAGNAAYMADMIKQSAEKGSAQMGEMMLAVSEISKASQSIGKVIKVIDDIAFQTNILALNASVEAARAGQHGKGFAVVADEVRTLAAKSADAAKDTSTLIKNSIEKAELGANIAKETSASLEEIVSGINESSRVVSEIARSSEEQTISITHINTGIDQVAQVVQQNSATAQESAAASEEMSGQSEILKQMVARFKLKEGSAAKSGKPSAAPSERGMAIAGSSTGSKY